MDRSEKYEKYSLIKRMRTGGKEDITVNVIYEILKLSAVIMDNLISAVETRK